MKSKPEIIAALESTFEEVCVFLENQKEGFFETGPESKWQAGQHLNHLIQSTAPISKAMKLPAFALRYKFGKPNRPGRDYEKVVARYREKLGAGGVAPTPFLPKAVFESEKGERISQFRNEKQKLIKQVNNWSEAKLDKCLLPHPLLGKVTLREMLFFTNYHTQHHLKILKDKY